MPEVDQERPVVLTIVMQMRKVVKPEYARYCQRNSAQTEVSAENHGDDGAAIKSGLSTCEESSLSWDET